MCLYTSLRLIINYYWGSSYNIKNSLHKFLASVLCFTHSYVAVINDIKPTQHSVLNKNTDNTVAAVMMMQAQLEESVHTQRRAKRRSH